VRCCPVETCKKPLRIDNRTGYCKPHSYLSDYVKGKKKEWIEENKEHVLARQRDYQRNARKKDPEKFRNYCRGWAKKPKSRFYNAKKFAERRGIAWELTFEQWFEVASKPCTYCWGSTGTTGSGLDRDDNSKGYTASNILPCCGDCNRFKSNKLTSTEAAFLIDCLQKIRQKENVWDE
jgi:hypothetical protein